MSGNSTDPSLPDFAMTNLGMRIVSSTSLCLGFMYLGHMVREHLRITRKWMLPASLIGGLLGFIFIQLCSLSDSATLTVEHDWIVGWNQLPSFLINVVFATLFMGSKVPSVKEAWKWAGPQLAYGQILAWGNWAVGTFVTAVILIPVWGTNVLFGSLLPVGFEGGHGTAAGLKDSYTNLGFPDGGDLAVTSATIGICLGVFSGTVICNIGNAYMWSYKSYKKKKQEGKLEQEDEESDVELALEPSPQAVPSMRMQEPEEPSGPQAKPSVKIQAPEEEKVFPTQDLFARATIPVEERVPGSYLTVSGEALDTMALQVSFVGLAMMLAYWTKRALMAIEGTNDWLTEYSFFTGFPLFPMCMLWGLVIQILTDKYCSISPIDRGSQERIGGAALDFLVLTAIATTSVDAVAGSLAPLMVLVIIGLAWQLVCFFLIAPVMLPDFWFERAIAELGKGMGTTSVGLLLLRMVDPNAETPAMKAFSCKQLLHEPFMGGGLVTSTLVPLIASIGNWAVFGISAGIMLVWVIVWFLLFRKQKLGPRVQYRFDPRYNPM